MLKVEAFKKLTTENKSDYLHEMFYDNVKDNKKVRKAFLIFIYNSDDEELVEFYDAIIHPEKRKWYMDRQNTKIKNRNNEMRDMSKKLFEAKTQMYDSIDKNEAEKILDNIQ